MEIDNAVDPRTHLKRLIEHEDLVILSVNDRQGLKKAMDRKRKYVYELWKKKAKMFLFQEVWIMKMKKHIK